MNYRFRPIQPLLLAAIAGFTALCFNNAASAHDPAVAKAVAPPVNKSIVPVLQSLLLGDAPVGTAPVPVIASPAQGATFKAGDTLSFSGSATDAEDGVLASNKLVWWADLHHDTHDHPLQQPTVGGSGMVTIPVRGETSDNIWYRFHLKATDSAGRVTEVTRDILPKKSTVTLATSPAGLKINFDGQPTSAPVSVLGVVGMERDLAAPDQNLNGRRYHLTSWSNSGAATQTILWPNVNTTYTATFADIGIAVNDPPSVTLSAAANGILGVPMTLSATATDSDGDATVAQVEFFDNANLLGADTSSPFSWSWAPSSLGSHQLTARATDNVGATGTSAIVTVNVVPATGDQVPPTVSLTAPLNLASGIIGTLNLSATASDNVGVVGVEFQFDGVKIGAEDSSAPYQASIDTGAYSAGQHVLRARARDAAGNLSAWAVATIQLGGSKTVPDGFTKNESWVTGLSSSTAFVQTPDGRMLIAQQSGKLRVVKNGVLLPTEMRQFTVDSNGERGFIGLALHPNFATNGWIYVYYTTTENGVHNRISRIVANGDVSTATETVLIDLPTLSATNHNGGAMNFGLDGKLYVGVGENATGSNSQSLTTPLGKMLRFNDDGSIPSDNPFYNSQTGLARAIWALGLRNPFTFAIQPGTGRMHINDVGQVTWEEINLGVKGANYGWPGSEGMENITTGLTAPIFTYKHSAANPAGSGPGGFFTGFCIAGSTFYPSLGNFPASFRGNYFFADYLSTFIARLDLANNNAVYAFAKTNGQPIGMLVGADSALYVLTRGAVTRISANAP
ncbi:MAG: PQQ-dependent sugar dehydrogenase [Pseudomonadota bacterium]